MSDFTFNEFLTGILKFNDENIMHIGFNADTEDIIITNMNASADTSKTLQTNLNGGGGADLGQKTITVNGVYDASDDSLDGYDQVTVNVPVPTLGTKSITANGTYTASSDNLGGYSEVTVNVSSGISVDDLATNTKPSGAVTLSPSVTTIEQYAFANKPITSISGAGVTHINSDAFRGTLITSISDSDFPLLWQSGTTQWMSEQFSNMPELLTIKLTGAMSLQNGSGVLQNNPKMTSAEFPNATTNTIGSAGFQNNAALVLCDIGRAGIGTNCFKSCNALRTLIIRRTDAVVTLNAWSAAVIGGIYNNPTDSTIYVPESLLTSYQAASNWSAAYAAGVTFAKIEGSAYE